MLEVGQRFQFRFQNDPGNGGFCRITVLYEKGSCCQVHDELVIIEWEDGNDGTDYWERKDFEGPDACFFEAPT